MMNIQRYITYLFLPVILIAGCAKLNDNLSNEFCENIAFNCVFEKKKVELITSKGKIIIELDGESAPLTTGNFLDLVNRGVYDGTTFHRVIKEPEPFVAQGGDPLSKNHKVSSSEYGTGSFVDPQNGQSRIIPLEIKLINQAIPSYNNLISNPFDLNLLTLRHEKGSISMARSISVDSASSQFFISLTSLPELDGRYAVFGKVVEGMDVLSLISKGDRIIKVQLIIP